MLGLGSGIALGGALGAVMRGSDDGSSDKDAPVKGRVPGSGMQLAWGDLAPGSCKRGFSEDGVDA